METNAIKEEVLDIVEHQKELMNEANVQEAKEVIANISDPRTVVNAYLRDKGVNDNLRTWAKYLEERFSGNWFTMDKVMKKTPLKSLEEANGVFSLLVIKGLVHRELQKGVLKYKVTMNPSEKIALLRSQLVDIDLKRMNIVKEIERLKGDV